MRSMDEEAINLLQKKPFPIRKVSTVTEQEQNREQATRGRKHNRP